jgi:hypothetical protein
MTKANAQKRWEMQQESSQWECEIYGVQTENQALESEMKTYEFSIAENEVAA